MPYSWITLFLLLSLWNAALVFAGLSDEELLDTKLSGNFDVRVRPRITPEQPANISVSTSLSHIHSLDLNKAELDLTVWMELTWMDPRLRWNVDQTENKIRQLVLPENNVWTPDITLSNAVAKVTPIFGTQVVVQATGTIKWLQAYRTVIGCVTNATSVEQTCVLTIGSWRYDSTDVDLYSISENFTATDDFFNHEWDLQESYIDRMNLTRAGIVYPFLEVMINLVRLTAEETETRTPEPICMTESSTYPSAASSINSFLLLNLLALCLLKISIL